MNFRLLALAVAGSLAASGAFAATLINDGTTGLYNNGIGNLLNGTSAFFPDSGTAIDPTASLASAPDLSAASVPLGNWLTTPAAPGGAWSGPTAIPGSWTVESETAIIYEINGGATGLSNVIASIGVDNGVLVWLNGVFVGGDQAPGGAVANEYSYNLGNLGAGLNYLQILREDHGGGTDWTIEVTGDVGPAPIPLPAGGLLLIAGLGALAGLRRRA